MSSRAYAGVFAAVALCAAVASAVTEGRVQRYAAFAFGLAVTSLCIGAVLSGVAWCLREARRRQW